MDCVVLLKILEVHELITIGFEGVDGSGKTTQVSKLHLNLLENGIKSRIQEQPKMTPLGKVLRQYLKREDKREHDPYVLALMFSANRAEMWEERKQFEKDGVQVLISDRTLYSNYLYSDLDLEWFKAIEKYSPKPDLTIILDVDPEVALKRCGGEDKTYENLEVLKRVSEGYRTLKDEFDGDFARLNIREWYGPDMVFKAVRSVVIRHFNEFGG